LSARPVVLDLPETLQGMTACKAALNVKGEHFGCDETTSHDIHGNRQLGAIWASAEEVERLDRLVEQGAHDYADDCDCDLCVRVRIEDLG
jgi:hypothetical protein